MSGVSFLISGVFLRHIWGVVFNFMGYPGVFLDFMACPGGHLSFDGISGGSFLISWDIRGVIFDIRPVGMH